MLGVALAVVGLTDVALLWYPARWASIEWEFGTISSTFDALPLATIGLCTVAMAAVARGYRWSARIAALALLVVCLALVAMAVVFWLDVPLALRAVAAPLKPALKRAIVKTGSISACYIALYAVFGVWVLRRSTSAKGASR